MKLCHLLFYCSTYAKGCNYCSVYCALDGGKVVQLAQAGMISCVGQWCLWVISVSVLVLTMLTLYLPGIRSIWKFTVLQRTTGCGCFNPHLSIHHHFWNSVFSHFIALLTQSSYGEPILFSYWIYIELYWDGKCIFERHVIVTRLTITTYHI